MKQLTQTLLLALAMMLWLAGCTSTPTDVVMSGEQPKIFPDYNAVTIPATIAPMNFCMENAECLDVTVKGEKGGEMHVNGDYADFDISEWHELVAQNKGGKLTFTVIALQNGKWTQYKPFDMFVSSQSLDDYGLTYRRVAPGYEVYSKMGLYQRDLSNFDEDAILENTASAGACLNCHTPNATNPKQFVFHVRGIHGATMIQKDGKREFLQAKNELIGGSMVYPYWHKDGKLCAFSTNSTHQAFHTSPKERIEVFDQSSDVFVYNTETHEVISDSLLFTKDHYETYPAFSPDGKTLYFVSSLGHPIPAEYKLIQYNLCSISFDAGKLQYGDHVDTLYNAAAEGKSITFPRPSYDGKYLMFTMSDYGCFPIWHKEADLWLMDLKTKEVCPMKEANSDDTESFHNWSSNSRWFVFSSRRYDGLYTQLFLSSIDEKGRATKPFLLPQENPKKYYSETLFSFNTPDFTKEKVDFDQFAASREINSDERVETKAK